MKIFNKINTIFLRYRNNLIIASFILLLIISIINIYYVVEVTSITNDECLWIDKSIKGEGRDFESEIYFDFVKEDGITYRAGIRNGDRLIAFDGIKLKNSYHAALIANSKKSGETIVYTVERDGKQFNTNILTKKLIIIQHLAFSLLGFIWIIVGFVVILTKPHGKVQRLFYYIGAFFVLFLLYVYNNYTALYHPEQLTFLNTFIGLLILFSGCYLPVAIIHFFIRFPSSFNFAEKKWFKIFIGIIPWVIFISFFAAFTYVNNLPRQEMMSIRMILNNLLNLMLIVGLAIGLVFLLINYFRIKTKSLRKSLTLILIGYILGCLSFVYTFYMAPTFGGTLFNNPEYFSPIILLLLIPISFGVSIFKYQLMDVSIVVKNTIVYLSATFLLAAIYFLIMYTLGQGISSMIGTEYQGMIAGVIFIIFAMVFQSTKDKFQDVITKRFYPEQFAYQQILIKFSRDLPSIIGLDNILNSMQNTFVDELKLKRFGIVLLHEKNTDIKFDHCLNINCQALRMFKDQNQLLALIENKKSLSKNIVIEQSDFIEAFGEEDSQLLQNEQVFTIIPIFAKNSLTGLILLGLKASGSQFAGKDLDLLNVIANQASISIENAKLYEREAERISLERDLETARNIQQGLLPRDIPYFKGFDISGRMIPAQQVGGDYFDIIKISDKKFFIIIGDVSGKGLSAALYMTSLQAMMQIYCSKILSPKDILVEINKRLYNSLERNWFVTLSLALFDTERMKIRFCRAGHTPLIIKSGHHIEFLQPKGIGLGLESGNIFDNSIEEIEIDLLKDTDYLFFSDGVSEAMNDKNELYGESRIVNIIETFNGVSSKDYIDGIIKDIDRFKNNKEQNDDISIVLVKTKGIN